MHLIVTRIGYLADVKCKSLFSGYSIALRQMALPSTTKLHQENNGGETQKALKFQITQFVWYSFYSDAGFRKGMIKARVGVYILQTKGIYSVVELLNRHASCGSSKKKTSIIL